ncbi:hypothetical protein H072_1403 [Dactylellina haptotyla CBS 200.50]|uniref:Uncharacterized protein n=1 Tax=Dactylellina haptotyla (strain CBS 200.50) TaxID=1284197 RepID=S8ANV8_DACHA|nr:hypothetical protein H072_1403 [Dactylellina haptotyla CBS 200.50]
MAFEVDNQPSHLKALNDTVSTTAYVPITSPSAKRKRDVLLYITPVSANTSFNSSNGGSFGADGACDGCEGGSGIAGGASQGDGEGGKSGCDCEARGGMKDGSGVGTETQTLAEAEVDVPSPRTKVANKLESLSLLNATGKDGKEKEPSKAAKVIKSWRKISGAGKFTGIGDQGSPGSQNIENTEATLQGGVDEDDHDINRTPRKKRATIQEPEEDAKSGDTADTPKKRNGKLKAAFREPEEVDMTASEVPKNLEESPSIDDTGNEPITFVGSSKQAPPSRRRLRSPPPAIEEEEEEDKLKRSTEEEDTDSDPDQTGIGYRPTAQQRELRNQKRMQQIKEYKARESREARAKRTTERRRRNVTERGESATSSTSSLLPGGPVGEGDEMVDVQKSEAVKRVHFAV